MILQSVANAQIQNIYQTITVVQMTKSGIPAQKPVWTSQVIVKQKVLENAWNVMIPLPIMFLMESAVWMINFIMDLPV